MKGDFSRDTFEARKQFSRVLMQQGRVQIDADWNEQSAILLHYLRTLATDIIGQHGGPKPGGFGITPSTDKNDLTIATGRYYVDGILCENCGMEEGGAFSYFNQPYYDPKESSFPPFPFPILVYLDVWERHITCFEDPDLNEPALNGIDTTTRAKVVWQVKLMQIGREALTNLAYTEELLATIGKGNARLRVESETPPRSADSFDIEPNRHYRGAENQLYRVEIHTGSRDETGNASTATFKWSRENGTVVFPVIKITVGDNTTTVTLANFDRDDKHTLCKGDWVELVDDRHALQNRADKLLRVISIDRDEDQVSLDGEGRISHDPRMHPLLRRWDQKPLSIHSSDRGLELSNVDNAAVVIDSETENHWLTLENGIQIQFLKPENGGKSDYRTGDYWLIPARVANGNIIWPCKEQGESLPQPAKGIEHHYAPLAIVDENSQVIGCRREFESIRLPIC